MFIKYFPLFILLLFCETAYSQQAPRDTAKEKESVAIAEIGGATSFNLKGGAGFGYDLAIEMTPIEDWLELELGVSPVFTNHSRETDIDLLFKKPWTLSQKLEFMLGIGPAFTHESDHGNINNFWSGELAVDLMFWPGTRHRFGLFVEPAYQYGFGQEHDQSIGLSAGLLIAIP